MICSCNSLFSRRHFGLLAITLITTACSDTGTQASSQDAVDFDSGTSCELDGMLLADYPGPKAQIHYVGQSTPSFFCDTVELFNTVLAAEQVRAIRAMYVQDMGKASWDAPRGHWINAQDAIYVIGSKRHGSMGPTIASFAQEVDAKQFVQAFGGKLSPFAGITREMVDLSGGALHDMRM